MAGVVALTIGVAGAENYARLAAPYYAAVATLIAQMHPWKIVAVVVTEEGSGHGAILQLTGEVRRHRDDPSPAARVVSHVQVGEAVETPIVFWTLLLVWPATSVRRRLTFVALGFPVFLGLEAVTTACQLVHSLAEASAILGGDPDPLTVWERWSRFLEAGGGFAVAVLAAVFTVAIAARLADRREIKIAATASAQARYRKI
jgi:hypothetical protein